MVDMYGNARKFERTKAGMGRWPITPKTRRVLEDYLNAKIEHLSPGRRFADLVALRRLCCGSRRGGRVVPGDVAALTVEDVQRGAAAWREEGRAGRLRRDSFRLLKRHWLALYRFAVGPRPTPAQARVLQALQELVVWPADVPHNLSVSRFYTYDEFRRILVLARRPQERALLALGWETTARPNEYLSLTVRDVEATAHGFTLRAQVSKQGHGVTRTRHLYVVAFRAEFAAFWESHAFRDDARHALFYRENRNGFGKPLGPGGANKMLKQYDCLSGVNRGGSLYWLRHSGYTHKVLQGMNPELAGADMGWVAGTAQRKRYTHLTDADVLRERLRLAGQRFEQEVQPQLRARICPACNQENSPVATHCRTCGQLLSIQDVLRELEELKANQAALVERTLAEIMAKHGLEPC